jgi:hypothetical protein
MSRATLPQIAHAIFELRMERKDRFTFPVKRHRLGGREQPVVEALEQRKARLRLHRLQRVADRRLRQRQFVRRRDRGPMADDCTQDLQLAQIHISVGYCFTTGEPTGMPCEIPLKVYPVKVIDEQVCIEV